MNVEDYLKTCPKGMEHYATFLRFMDESVERYATILKERKELFEYSRTHIDSVSVNTFMSIYDKLFVRLCEEFSKIGKEFLIFRDKEIERAEQDKARYDELKKDIEGILAKYMELKEELEKDESN